MGTRAVTTALQLETPHADVDSRRPIRAANGERAGKLTKYKVSELRAMNILEGLCEAVSRPEAQKWVMGPISEKSPKTSILKLVDKSMDPSQYVNGPDPAIQVQSY